MFDIYPLQDLIKKLLVIDRTKRIGNLKAGADDVKKHKWFKGVDWEDVYYRFYHQCHQRY